MSKTNLKPIPGAVLIDGIPHLPGPKGVKIPVANYKAQDLLQHEMVYFLTDYAQDLSAEIARFNGHSRADLAQFDALLAQEYGVTRDPEFKGNRTYTSADGKRQVKISLNDRVTYGPELQAAKLLLDELITENASGAGPVLMPLVNLAFRIDKEGKVDPNLLRAIRRLEVPDHRWKDICRAIDDAERVVDTTSYIRFYVIPEGRKPELIPLDIAGAHPTPEAFSRCSLRRQVEELSAQVSEARRLLSLARTYAEDGAMASMLKQMDAARGVLGDDDKAFTVPGIDGATAPTYVRVWLASLPPALLVDAMGAQVALDIQIALGELSQTAA